MLTDLVRGPGQAPPTENLENSANRNRHSHASAADAGASRGREMNGHYLPDTSGGNAGRNSGGPGGRIELDEFGVLGGRHADSGVNLSTLLKVQVSMMLGLRMVVLKPTSVLQKKNMKLHQSPAQ